MQLLTIFVKKMATENIITFNWFCKNAIRDVTEQLYYVSKAKTVKTSRDRLMIL